LGIEAPREITVVRAELVPERQQGPHRPAGVPAKPMAGPPGVQSPRAEFRIPQASAHESGNRRRGRSR
jgi:carbon storage regulator